MELKTNLQLLNEEAIKIGYTGAPFTSSTDALYWISKTKAGLTPGTPNSIATIVANNKTNIEALMKGGTYKGIYITLATLDAAYVGEFNAGDYALIGDREVYEVVVYSGKTWINPTIPLVTIGTTAEMPGSLGSDATGLLYFNTDTRTYYVWKESGWIGAETTPTIDGYKLRII